MAGIARVLGIAGLGIGATVVGAAAASRVLATPDTAATAATEVDDWDLRAAQDAVRRAAPGWSDDDVIEVAEVMLRAGMDRWDSAELVKAVVSNSPGDWSGGDEALVAAAAARADLDRWDVASVLAGARDAPSDWSSRDAARVMVVAIQQGKDRWDLASAMRRGSYVSGGPAAEVAEAIADLRGTSTGGGSNWDLKRMEEHLRSAAPDWSTSDRTTVAEVAVDSGAGTWDVTPIVSTARSDSPSGWSGAQEAVVAAAALRHDRDRWELASVLDGIESAPSSWSAHGQARVAAAALANDRDGWDVRSAITSAKWETSDPARQVVHAIDELDR
jgi:hypothetical protein